MSAPATTHKIEVTADDITRGIRHSDCQCPIARAIKRLLPEEKHVSVMDEYVIVGDQTFYLPAPAVEFIAAFDAASSPVTPFSFEL